MFFPQRNVSIAAVRGAVRPSNRCMSAPSFFLYRAHITSIFIYRMNPYKRPCTDEAPDSIPKSVILTSRIHFASVEDVSL